VRRPSVKELAKEVANRQPFRGDLVVRGAIEAAPLSEYSAALILGHLHICGNCAAFRFCSDPAGLGRCLRFNAETAPFVPFWCAGFEVSRTPAAPVYLPDPRCTSPHEGALQMIDELTPVEAIIDAN
jgi:hypothetical protein